jgi:hypothetical protein
MPTRITKDRTAFAALEDMRAGVLDPFNIVGYHVYGSGQTTICVSPAPARILRFDARKVRITQKPDFETSVTGIKNGTKLLISLIDGGIIRGMRGERMTKVEKETFARQAKEAGFVKSTIIKRAPAWVAWHAKLKAQLELVLQDKPSFKDESKVRETMDHFKSNMAYIVERYGWDLEHMKQMLDDSFNEFLVKGTMES